MIVSSFVRSRLQNDWKGQNLKQASQIHEGVYPSTQLYAPKFKFDGKRDLTDDIGWQVHYPNYRDPGTAKERPFNQR